MKKYKVIMVLFPDVTILDFVGPYQVFINVPCFEVVIVAESKNLIKAEGGFSFKADYAFEEMSEGDIIFVPGGRGVNNLLIDLKFLNFLKSIGEKADYITSVCSGSLLLAAAGLLKGFKATTHWRSLELLRMMNIETVEERVVIDRNRVTGGGVTSGIDFALVLTSIIGGEDLARMIQLQLEYNPQPPFEGGSPETVDSGILKNVIEKTQASFDLRKKILEGIIQRKESVL